MTADDPDDRIELPDDLAPHVTAASGFEDPPGTMAEWAARVEERGLADGVSFGATDMYVDEPTRHEVDFGGQVEHVPCVLDALIAIQLEGRRPATVRSTDPVTGGTVTVEVRDGEVSAAPADAVVSFGLARELPASGEGDALLPRWLGGDGVDETVQEAACAYINAFESRESYREWERSTDAVATPLTVERAAALARRTAGGPLFD